MSNDDITPSFSDDDLDKMMRRGYAEHIVDGIGDAMFGGWDNYRHMVRQEAWEDAANRFPGEDLRPQDEDDDYPVLHGTIGNWDFRHPVGGPYVDIHAPGSDQALECIHVGHTEDNQNLYKPSADEIRQAVREWDQESGDDYRRHYGL